MNMNENDKDLSCLHDPNYPKFVAYYLEHPIALYIGAGVSWSKSPKFGIGLWNDFVRRILLYDKATNPETVNDFDRNLVVWKDKPWEMAEWVANQIGQDEFKRRVTALIQNDANFQKAYKLLSGKFLENARTLNSTVAFCAGFASGKITEGGDGHWLAVYQRSINHRIHAVVTSNYDPFLEAASSTIFRKPILKPVAARGSSVGSLMEIPVFHIHGYVEFPNKFQKQKLIEHRPFVEPVITTSDYKAAWKSRSAYNPTMGPQIHILRHYAVLFIGFSFRDWKVNDLLKKLNKEREKREDRLYHYAIMSKDEMDAERKQYFEKKLGVRPIVLDSFTEVKDLLSHLYQQALMYDNHGNERIKLALYGGKSKNRQDKQICLSVAEYFEELYNCRLSMVRKKKSYVYRSSTPTVKRRKLNRNL